MIENKNKDINVKVEGGRFFAPFFDTYIAHKISSLTECNIRDVSILRELWLNNFILTSLDFHGQQSC